MAGSSLVSRPGLDQPAIPLGSALAILGGLSLIGSFFMPWVEVPVNLVVTSLPLAVSGSELRDVLMGTGDLAPLLLQALGSTVDVAQFQALLALVPLSGALALALALADLAWPRQRRLVASVLLLTALAPLVGLLTTVYDLAEVVSPALGLGVIVAASLAIIFGAGLNLISGPPPARRLTGGG